MELLKKIKYWYSIDDIDIVLYSYNIYFDKFLS
jgi:hypothetical protein